MSSLSIEHALPLLVPYFSETASLDENAKTIGRFLSTLFPLDSVVLSRPNHNSHTAAAWASDAAGRPAAAQLARQLEMLGRRLLDYTDSDHIALGEDFDAQLKLPRGTHAIACAAYYQDEPCGFLVALRSGSGWSAEEQRLFSSLRGLISTAFSLHYCLKNGNLAYLLFNTILDDIKANICITEVNSGRILFMNQVMKEDFGVEEPEGKNCYQILQKDTSERCSFCPIVHLLDAKAPPAVIEWDEQSSVTGNTYHHYDSLIRWLDGSVVHLQQSVDVTDLKIANTDELTALLGRRPGKAALQQTLWQARQKGRTATVCFCDMNNLKLVNDHYGHAEGDRLILLVVNAIKALLHDGEYAFRMSGDEFVVVFLSSQRDALERLTQAQKDLQNLQEPFLVGFCFGLVEVQPDHSIDSEDVLLLADERMYEQKRRFHIARNEQRLKVSQSSLPQKAFYYDKDFLYEALTKSTDDYPFICNMDTGVFRYAPAMVEEFGLPGEVVENAAAVWGARVHESDKSAFLQANQVIADGRALSHCVEYRAMNRFGQWVWVRCRGQVETNENGAPVLFAGFISKLGTRNRVDNLTGLSNKLEFEDHISNHISFLSDMPLGVIILGLDDLKHINDLYNRAFGDEVIRITAQRLQAILPPEATLYRLDGDEFGIVVHGANHHSLEELCRTINYSFEIQQEHSGKKFYCTLSGGSAVFPRDATNYQDIAKFAGYCMSHAKHQGKSCCVPYSPGILEHRARALEMVEDLRYSVKNGCENFSLNFQPLVEALTGQLVGTEALLRWHSVHFGSVSPVEFIPLLEQTGMIIPVGKWVLSTAIRLCAPWLKGRPDFILHVNLSYLQVQGTDLAPFVLRVLEDYDFPHENLVLELTESHFIQDNRHVQGIFSQLRQEGIRIAVDDFGTGFSSLSILKDIPADIVKIDRAFIRDIHTSTFDANFIRFVVTLCHDVGLQVCLEGVETDEDYHSVSNMELDMMQGYLFGRPITAKEFELRL